MRIISYLREPPVLPAETFEYDLDKWSKFDSAVGDAGGDTLLVAFPEVLGDSYWELVINLGKVAASGKRLVIAKPSPAIRGPQ